MRATNLLTVFLASASAASAAPDPHSDPCSSLRRPGECRGSIFLGLAGGDGRVKVRGAGACARACKRHVSSDGGMCSHYTYYAKTNVGGDICIVFPLVKL